MLVLCRDADMIVRYVNKAPGIAFEGMEMSEKPLTLILEPRQVIRKGQRHPHIYIVQAILAVLEDAYQSIGPVSHSGILDEATFMALSNFQNINGLPRTGHLDKQTWKALALHYPQAARLAENGRNV
jgi:murein L,D-transpeptidase YcbB/YkuD